MANEASIEVKFRDLTIGEMEDLKKRFTYHPPKEGQPIRYETLRSATLDLAGLYSSCALPSRELSLALTKLEEASMWVNAAIARNEGGGSKE